MLSSILYHNKTLVLVTTLVLTTNKVFLHLGLNICAIRAYFNNYLEKGKYTATYLSLAKETIISTIKIKINSAFWVIKVRVKRWTTTIKLEESIKTRANFFKISDRNEILMKKEFLPKTAPGFKNVQK